MVSPAGTVIQFDYQGKRYELSQRHMTPSEALTWRKTFGLPFAHMAEQGIDLDVIAGIIWIIERRTNPQASFEDIANQTIWDDLEPVATRTDEDSGEQVAVEADEDDDADPTESAGS